MSTLSLEDVSSLLEAASPAVLTTTRQDGTPLTSPVWFRWTPDAFEVVILEGDIKLTHLRRDPQCTFVIFETVAPFRGVEIRGEATLLPTDVRTVRLAIATKYLGREAAEAFVTRRGDTPSVLLRLPTDRPRVWSQAGLHPTS